MIAKLGGQQKQYIDEAEEEAKEHLKRRGKTVQKERDDNNRHCGREMEVHRSPRYGSLLSQRGEDVISQVMGYLDERGFRPEAALQF